MFIGRDEQLTALGELLERARTRDDRKPGQAVLVRGRRRVGKSRLVEEFVQRADVPHLFYAATGRPTADEIRLFAAEVRASNLPGAAAFEGVIFDSWDAALRFLATALPDDEASVVVIDEFPYLIDRTRASKGRFKQSSTGPCRPHGCS